MLATLTALLAPPHCLACDEPVPAGTRVCPACRAAMPWLAAPAAAARSPGAGSPAAPAAPTPPTLWSPLAFDGPARALVHALKFGGRVAAADVMAAQIAANAPPGLLAGDLIVPVPAHPGRARLRGFDHAAVLAQRLGRRTGLPVRAVLVRRGDARQVGASRAQRLGRDLGIAVPSGVARGGLPARAVVVDDVRTTGATLAACARALRAAGVKEVVGVSYAFALG